MERMEVWDWLSLVGVVALSIILLYSGADFIRSWYQRSRIRDRYAWLRVMNRSEWLTREEISRRMKSLVGTAGTRLIAEDLEDLEDEELIECREQDEDDAPFSVYEYRLTPKGRRERFLLYLSREEGVSGARLA